MSRREAARALSELRRDHRRTQRRVQRRRAWSRRVPRRRRPRQGVSPLTIDAALDAASGTSDVSAAHDGTSDADGGTDDVAAAARARLLDERTWVSLERIEAARARMEAGEEPSGDVVAEMIVRRAICDRLR
ncbi:MAG TPA: hypothetical protein VE575_11695 [Acidimicrobiales bacterium]|nr:hypothetical protein [Acidimicrobiales bacterium]